MTEVPAVKSVSIILPVFNEQDSLRPLYQELSDAAGKLAPLSFEFLFIDDGSRDGSLDALRDLAASDARVKVVRFIRNAGQTAAMSCGIRLAQGDVIIPMDADLQNDPADIPKFLEKIADGYTCVSGWRQQRQDGFWLRRAPSWMANGMISWLTGVQLHDYGCSMKAYRRELIQGIELYGEMHRFIPAYAAWSGGRVTEIVVNHRARRFGVSKYGLSRVFKVILDLIVVKFLTQYFNKPIHFFGAVGFVSLAIGGVAECWAIILRLQGTHLVQTPLPTIGALFIIVGVQFVLFGLMAEVLMRTYYESTGTQPYRIRETINIPSKV